MRIEKVFNFITSNFSFSKKTKILDIGCYGSHLLYKLHARGYSQLFGIDIVKLKNEYDFEYNFSKEDIEKKTSFPDKNFDICVMSHVLEHLYDVPAAVREIKRILKVNGSFVLCLPLDSNLFARTRYLFNAPIHNPFSTGTHIKFYKYKKVLEYFKKMVFQ